MKTKDFISPCHTGHRTQTSAPLDVSSCGSAAGSCPAFLYHTAGTQRPPQPYGSSLDGPEGQCATLFRIYFWAEMSYQISSNTVTVRKNLEPTPFTQNFRTIYTSHVTVKYM